MINRKTISLLLFIPVLVFSQFKTPFESYDYEKDTEYKQQLTSLKKSEKKGAVEVIESSQRCLQNIKIGKLLLHTTKN